MYGNATMKPFPLYAKLKMRGKIEDAFKHFSALNSDQVCIFPFLLPLAIIAKVI